MNCEQARELLERIALGTLSGKDARAVRRHYASCAACAAVLTPSQWVEVLPAIDETVEPSEDFAQKFYSRLRDRPKPWWRRAAARPWGRPLAVAGAMAAVALAGILIIRYPGFRNDPAADLNDSSIVENLPLLEDLAVVSNLDLLEDFDTIDNLPNLMRGGGAN
jgi:hypothetical protein